MVCSLYKEATGRNTYVYLYIKRLAASAFSLAVGIGKGEFAREFGFDPIHGGAHNVKEGHGFNVNVQYVIRVIIIRNSRRRHVHILGDPFQIFDVIHRVRETIAPASFRPQTNPVDSIGIIVQELLQPRGGPRSDNQGILLLNPSLLLFTGSRRCWYFFGRRGSRKESRQRSSNVVMQGLPYPSGAKKQRGVGRYGSDSMGALSGGDSKGSARGTAGEHGGGSKSVVQFEGVRRSRLVTSLVTGRKDFCFTAILDSLPKISNDCHNARATDSRLAASRACVTRTL